MELWILILISLRYIEGKSISLNEGEGYGGLFLTFTSLQQNSTAMNGLVSELQDKLRFAMEGGRDKAIEKHKSRGKLLARERIDALVDKGYVVIGLLSSPCPTDN